MRVILYTGKGGVGKTTTAAATAVRLADRGLKTLLLSTDAAHSLADALGCPLSGEPSAVIPGLEAAQLDSRRRLESAWTEISGYLASLLAEGGLDPILAGELTVLPGMAEALALLEVGELAERGRWDALVLDCAPTAETLRLLALPEAFGWYLQRVFPVHRRLARGLRPMAALLGRPATLPGDAVFDAALRLATKLDRVRSLLADARTTSVRLVLTPEAVVLAESRRTYTALALHGYRVDEVVVNRVFPSGGTTVDLPGTGAAFDDAAFDDGALDGAVEDGEPFDGAAVSSGGEVSAWQRGWVAAQARQLAAVEESFAGVAVRRLAYRGGEPVGLPALRALAEELYSPLPGTDPSAGTGAGMPLTVSALGGDRFQLRLDLPLADPAEVSASRRGDELIVTVADSRRVLALPSVLRRCRVLGGTVSDGALRLDFEPDPELWPASEERGAVTGEHGRATEEKGSS